MDICYICGNPYSGKYPKEVCQDCQYNERDLDGNKILLYCKDRILYKMIITDSITKVYGSFDDLFYIYDFPCFCFMDSIDNQFHVIVLKPRPVNKYIEWFKRRYY